MVLIVSRTCAKPSTSKSFSYLGVTRVGSSLQSCSYKVKLETLDKNTKKYQQMLDLACNYLYRFVTLIIADSDRLIISADRYGALIVLANYLIERKAKAQSGGKMESFPAWLREHREVSILENPY